MALLHVAKVIEEAHELTDGWGVEFSKPTIDITKFALEKTRS